MSSRVAPHQHWFDRFLFGPRADGAQAGAMARPPVRGMADVQGWLPLRDIQGGMIALGDGAYAVVDEVGALNLQSLAPECP